MTIRAILVFSSALLVTGPGCGKKDDAGGQKQETTPVAKSDPGAKTAKTAKTANTANTADEGGQMKPPEVAIGATRTEQFAGPMKKVAETDEYAVAIKLPETAKAGEATSARVVLHPKKGWKLNEEFPYSLVITAPAGVKVDKAKQAKKDAVVWEQKSAAEWAISFTPEAAGTKAFAADFDFAVCTDATCNPYSEKLAFNVDVK